MFSKNELLTKFREIAEEFMQEITNSNYRKKADLINKKIWHIRDDFLKEAIKLKISREWTKKEYLENILLIHYVAYVIILEYRNIVWNYDYMTFSRRIGELWEPFCKLPFLEPINNLELRNPPKFNDVKNKLQKSFDEHIYSLNIDKKEKEQIRNNYMTIWDVVRSGSIKLELDLHFKLEDIIYNIDYKSGFSSNEKGNTNRLLVVASIYNYLPNNKMLIFVRQKEEDNNHYLQTLKKSPYCEVYCADAAYEKIEEFSGFNLRLWMNNHMDWKNDISTSFRSYLEQNDLLKYLTW